MAFGLTAAQVALGSAVVGGVMGSQGSTQQGPQIDPRLAKYIYGEDGNSGLIKDAADTYKGQMQQGGLNDNQRAGLEYLRQLYTSPYYQQGYNRMGQMSQAIQDKYAQKYGLPVGASTQFSPQMQVEQAPIRSNAIPMGNPYMTQAMNTAPTSKPSGLLVEDLGMQNRFA